MNKAPLLKPKHFDGLRTRLTDQGLRLDCIIGEIDRELSCPNIGETYGDTLDFLSRLANGRPATRIAVNPKRPSARSLKLMLEAAQNKYCPDETISIGYGLPKGYGRRWTREISSNENYEGQSLVVTAFDGLRPVGYAGLVPTISYEPGSAFLHFSMDMVYVTPERRGEGFGLDLSVACGLIASDLLTATYRAVPAHTVITPYLTADYESEGGEAVTGHILNCLEFETDNLSLYGKRRTISVKSPMLDAGY